MKREEPTDRAPEAAETTVPQLLDEAGAVLDTAKGKRPRRRKSN